MDKRKQHAPFGSFPDMGLSPDRETLVVVTRYADAPLSPDQFNFQHE
ncbi:MAG TPA: hypothetical protein VEI57_03590 [Nitrospirota bacterium]|nr:hypothetical protein [Nitrospirota bacterium]